MQTPSLARRFASLFYDALLLGAVLFLAGLLVVGLLPDVSAGRARHLYQAWLFLVAGVYLTWFWCHGGQTLAMKTWRIRVVEVGGMRLGFGRAWLRYGLAAVGLAAGGMGFLWAFFDRDRLFLHDRLADTRLVAA
ncbi:RDD family protein [Parasulfuritortus cantonensis]|uniref:RDD family protein n=1 Tax=Parasulfuritortus cantonensis TaxID=2528202 RepID=A0A4R1BPV4_9PROT|nr:RDD family protein [Parasulfuritortus cantonensis]TCJ19528.1 RDD family protein [Parasulfuritortus cantonensis]